MSNESLATTLRQWEQLLAAGEGNAEDLGYLLEYREELQGLVAKARELSGRQDALNAMKQQVTRDLDTVKERGRELAQLMRMGVHTRFGRKDPKLIEFGLQPRKRKGSPPAGEPPAE
jgi:hypothetical protein